MQNARLRIGHWLLAAPLRQHAEFSCVSRASSSKIQILGKFRQNTNVFYGKGCIGDNSEMSKVIDDAQDGFNYKMPNNYSCVAYTLNTETTVTAPNSSNASPSMIGLEKIVSLVTAIVASVFILRNVN